MFYISPIMFLVSYEELCINFYYFIKAKIMKDKDKDEIDLAIKAVQMLSLATENFKSEDREICLLHLSECLETLDILGSEAVMMAWEELPDKSTQSEHPANRIVTSLH